ncbi:MAG: AMP-dependent synthetase/ligase [Thermoanaerobaculia bacterium]
MDASLKARSIPHLFLSRVDATPGRAAYLFPAGNGWKSLTWKEAEGRVRAIACGLLSLGLLPEDRVGIVSSTRLEWILADLGVLCAGGVTTTVYAASTPEDMAFILSDSRSVVVFAEDVAQANKVLASRSHLPGLRQIVLFDGSGGVPEGVLLLEELEARGREWDAGHPGAFEESAGRPTLGTLATLIYTSGTTGRPKGVELTHDNWVFEAESIGSVGIIGPSDLQYLWLPLAHVFGKTVVTICIGIGIPTAVDGRVDRIAENLAAVKPTFVGAVPRIFEKIHAKVLAQALEAGGLKAAIFRWALEVGRKVSALRKEGRRPGVWLALRHGVADRLVFRKMRDRFGGRLRFFFSGSAPLAREIGEFFDAFGVTILEGYGLTETTAITFFNRLDENRCGTVGTPIPGMEVKIAGDGEILLRGRGIMRGYHGLSKETAETLDREGWLHTGDIGAIDDAGHLAITDRKKDLIKTSGGKYVAPQVVEGLLKVESSLISYAILLGDNRSFCTALISLSEEEIVSWAKASGLAGKPYEELVKDDRVFRLLQPHIDKVNSRLARHETIKRFAILPSELKIENGELTPSLKVRRKTVEMHYRQLLDSLYAEAPPPKAG